MGSALLWFVLGVLSCLGTLTMVGTVTVLRHTARRNAEANAVTPPRCSLTQCISPARWRVGRTHYCELHAQPFDAKDQLP